VTETKLSTRTFQMVNGMPKFSIEVQKEDGTIDIILREFYSKEEALEKISEGEVDMFSGLKVNYKVRNLEEVAENFSVSDMDLDERRGVLIEEAKVSGDWSQVSISDINQVAKNIILTTAYAVSGYDIIRDIEVVTAECVFGVNLFRDFFVGARGVVGGRSAASQKVLRDARNIVLSELRREALMTGADAVIAIDLDYQELSGRSSGGLLMIVASGTAVAIRAKPTET